MARILCQALSSRGQDEIQGCLCFVRGQCGLVYASLEEMHRAIGAFLDPILQARVPGHRWQPERWAWVL